MITLENNIIRCKKLATIVSCQKSVIGPFISLKEVSTSAYLWRVVLHFFNTKQQLRVSGIWLYYFAHQSCFKRPVYGASLLYDYEICMMGSLWNYWLIFFYFSSFIHNWEINNYKYFKSLLLKLNKKEIAENCRLYQNFWSFVQFCLVIIHSEYCFSISFFPLRIIHILSFLKKNTF